MLCRLSISTSGSPLAALATLRRVVCEHRALCRSRSPPPARGIPRRLAVAFAPLHRPLHTTPTALTTTEPAPPPTLRPYQQECIDHSLALMESGIHRQAVSLPVGEYSSRVQYNGVLRVLVRNKTQRWVQPHTAPSRAGHDRGLRDAM